MTPTQQAPEAPTIERMRAAPAPAPQAPIRPVQQPLPPAGWYAAPSVPPMIPPSERDLVPSATQRMWLGIVSLLALIPLLAIALGFTTTVISYVSAGVAVFAGLLAALFVCAAVLAVNLFFALSGSRYRR